MQAPHNEPRGSAVNLPKMAVITASSEPPKNFAYSGNSFTASTPSAPTNTSAFYNEVLFEIIEEYDVFAFLEEENDFAILESCDIIIDNLYQNDMIGAAYSDCIIAEKESSLISFSPSFSHDNYTHNNRIFHQPIFVKREALKYAASVLSLEGCFSEAPPQYFDSRIKKLCFHGLTGLISSKFIILHITKALFTSRNKTFQSEEIDGDLKLLFS